MYRFLLLWAACLFRFLSGQAQTDPISTCSFSATKLYYELHDSEGHSKPEALLIPSTFSGSAVKHCGKFDVYFEDIDSNTNDGFDDPGEGITRQNTLCYILNYYQSIFDFSAVPDTMPIRLRIKRSFTPAHPARGSIESFCGSGPYYNPSSSIGDTVNGYAWDLAHTGIDPSPGNYHAFIRVDFDSITAMNEFSHILGHDEAWFEPVIMNSGLDSPSNCTWDLATILSHAVAHCIGWFSWTDNSHGLTKGPYVTNVDTSIHYSDSWKSMTASLSLTHYLTTPFPTADFYWINGKQPPHNQAVHPTFSHLADYTGYNHSRRVTPGDAEPNVMSWWINKGLINRELSKIEIETFHDIIGYDYNPTYASGSAAKIANRIPWSKKMAFTYNPIYDSSAFVNIVPADFTITNNIGSSLVIDLMADTTLIDEDGDSIFVKPGSIVNFRGCGEGGNNHNLLSVDATGTKITYTPRHNFYGRAQFGLNIWDKKETGYFVLYTIDVKRGTNVSITPGTNMVLNGDFEEGTEVRLLNVAEFVNNSMEEIANTAEGRLAHGKHYEDCHSAYNSTAIHHSYVECVQTTKRKVGFGNEYYSFPWIWGHIYKPMRIPPMDMHYPDSSITTKSRFEVHREGNIYLLGDTLKKCHHYLLEFDATHTYWTGFNYTASDTITVGFASHDYGLHPHFTPLIRVGRGTTSKIDTGSWSHIRIPVTFCADTPATALYLRLANRYAPYGGAYLLDNLSLKEIPLSASTQITDSTIAGAPCSHILSAGEEISFACSRPLQYEWRKIDGTFVDTGRVIGITAYETTQYVVTVSDGCNTAKDTVSVQRCPCSPGSIFGSGTFSVISGTYAPTTASGNYFVENDFVIANTATFNGAVMLVAPNVKITVPDTVLWTLDNSHLFTCPDTNKMWKGITLSSGSTKSGRIAVVNNSIIEDAETAISAANPKLPSSGDIIYTNQAIFNRNQTAISIDGLTATTPSIYPFTIRGTIFTSRKMSTYTGYPTSWPTTSIKDFHDTSLHVPPVVINRTFPVAVLKSGGIAYAGIRLNNVGYTNPSTLAYAGIVVGDSTSDANRNLFDNTGDGIYANASNLKCLNNTFIRMPKVTLTGSGPLPTPSGCGVFATSTSANRSILQLPYSIGVNYNSRNWFYDCSIGIKVNDYYTITGKGCIIQSSNSSAAPSILSGFNISSRLYNSINVSENLIYNIPTGIYMFTVVTPTGYVPGQLTIDGNLMNANRPGLSYSSTNYINLGISVGASVSATTTFASTLMLIRDNTLTDVRNGIYANGIKRQQLIVDSNTIYLTPDATASVQYGINLTNCFSGNVLRNKCSTATSGGANADKVRAYYFGSDLNTLIQCNTAYNTGRGYEFFGIAQPQTQWTSNNMFGHSIGFALSAIIGDQGNTGRPSWNKWDGTWSPPKNQTFATMPSVTSKLYVRNLAAQSPLLNGALPSTYFYDFGATLFHTGILTHPDDPCTPIPPRWTPPKKPSFTFAPSLFRIIKNTEEYGSNEAISNWIAQKSLYDAIKLDSIIVDTIYSSVPDFETEAAITRFGWLAQIETALSEDDVVTAQTLLDNPVTAAGRIEVNNDVIVTDTMNADYITDNYIAFYYIYLDYLKGSVVDSASLANLTYLCPKTDGDVVYQARTLYHELYGYLGMYDDDSLCDIGSARITYSAGQDQHYSLYPNPNDGNLSIIQHTKDEAPVKLSIYNLQGRLIYQSTVQFRNSRMSLHLGDVQSGLYLLQLSDYNGRNFTLKFNIR